MKRIKDGNVIYLVKRDENCMKLRCSSCGVVKYEDEITQAIDKETGFIKSVCECGCNTFTPQIDLEELEELI